MAQAQQADGPVKLIDENRGNERKFPSWEDAQEKKNDFVSMGADPEDFVIEPLGEDSTTETARDGGQEPMEPDAVEDTDETQPSSETDQEPPEHTAVKTADPFPEITPSEDKARSVINQLDYADMTRLVWDPDVESHMVPYDPSTLPYDRPEPSAEAFDMFATIIEGTMGVQYSVADVEFEETDETLGCTVTIEKQSENGTKQLIGVKTRTNTNKDHWRERLFSKARRNALKQDIPPTWVSTLLRRYKGMTDAE